MKDQDPNKDHIMLVQMVFADHYTLRDPGKLYHTKGKSGTSDMLSGVFFKLTMPIVMWSSITKWL